MSQNYEQFSEVNWPVPGDMDSEDVAEQTTLSKDFELEGPLVGFKEPITCVLQSIAETSDPIYRSKRQWIILNYFAHRYITGDGNCGWRAIIFALFEILLRSGSRGKCLDQISRMKSMENSLKSAFNCEEFVYEDWRDCTLELLQWIADSIPCTDDAAALTEKLNDPSIAGAVIQWFRLIAGAWVTKHASLYEGFMGDVSAYKKKHIDPHAKEIEEHGIKILFDAVIEPAGIDVEIVYVDRSETGGIPNIHRYEPRLPSGEPKPGYRDTIRLLYSLPQGAHFDLLYKEQDFLETPQVLLSDTDEHYHEDNLLRRGRLLAEANFEESHGLGNRLRDPLFSFPGHPEFPTATLEYTGNFDIHEALQEEYLFDYEDLLDYEHLPINDPDVAFQRTESAFEAPAARHPQQIWRSRVDPRISNDPIRTHVLGYVVRDSHVPAPRDLQQPSNSVIRAR
ncbi:hypothetical protein MMC18_006441 [Xylographa bjoerkii]|nr:hypothetical protein [Xylographa bjoerkii]